LEIALDLAASGLETTMQLEAALKAAGLEMTVGLIAMVEMDPFEDFVLMVHSHLRPALLRY
jgi:hypothetical protein